MEICTFDKCSEKYIGNGDSGGPLVVHGKLIGVMAWSRTDQSEGSPDVFMKVSHPQFKNWIISNIYIIEGF